MKNLIYKTNPIIFHAQGKQQYCPLWERTNYLCEKNNKNKKIPNNLQIITFNNGKSFNGKKAGCLERSIKNQCFVLGKNILNWRNCLKIPLLVEFLEKNNTIEYIMGLDSSDVAVYSLEGILEKFLTKKCELLFNAEIICWPKSDFEEGWFIKPFCYLNAGAWIGKKDSVLNFYRECLSLITPKTRSEQECVKKIYKKWYPKILIDDTCSIFQTLNRIDENILEIP